MRYPLIILLCFGCVIHEKKGISNNETDTTLAANTNQDNEHSSQADSVVVYTYENDTLSQKIQIKYLEEGKISFVLSAESKKEKKASMIEGVAKSDVDVDPEIDEDEDGNAYPTQEYTFKEGACQLSIRIDMEQADKLRVLESNCKNYDRSCPLGSLGVLRRK